MTEKAKVEEMINNDGGASQSMDNDYVKMSSQWTTKLEEMREENQLLRLSIIEMEKEKSEFKQLLENIEQRTRALEAERDLAVKAQQGREKQLRIIAEEHTLEVQELEERISFLERKLETSESGRELQDRINYLEQELVSRETELRMLMQQNGAGTTGLTEQWTQLQRRGQEVEMQRLQLEKTELERNLDSIRSDSIRKDREISRLSRTLDEMDKELDLMKNFLQPAPKPATLSPSRNGTLSKRFSKRLSWLSERMGGAKTATYSGGSVDVQPAPTRDTGHNFKVKMRHARSLDTLDLPSQPRSLKIHWNKKITAKAPTNRIVRGAAVIDKGIIYFSSHLNASIWGYKTSQEQWFQLADCPNVFFALAIVNGCLTTIGGQRLRGSVEPTNELLSLVVGEHQLWVELNAPMPTKRINAVAVTTEQVLIVSGGANTKKLDAVEIMNLATKEWSVAMSLPRPLESVSAAYCHMTDHMFLMGGDEDGGPMKNVLTCSVEKLLHSCTHFNRIHNSSEVWETTSDLGVSYPTCMVVRDHLLALGGIEREKQQDSRAIYDYDFKTKIWRPLTLIPSPTHKLLAAMLPGNRLMVLGGFTKVNISNNVYFANVAFE